MMAFVRRILARPGGPAYARCEMTADLAPSRKDRSYRSRGVHAPLARDRRRRSVAGVCGPGGLLPTETALVTELGSGRSAVREAVKVLTAKGLVRTRTKTGT